MTQPTQKQVLMRIGKIFFFAVGEAKDEMGYVSLWCEIECSSPKKYVDSVYNYWMSAVFYDIFILKYTGLMFQNFNINFFHFTC